MGTAEALHAVLAAGTAAIASNEGALDLDGNLREVVRERRRDEEQKKRDGLNISHGRRIIL